MTVPVDVVSGWLGAGKTTLLRRLLETGAAGRVAVVVNELGDIGIDGAVVTGLGFAERMVELTSGCICCQLDTVHFEIALEELIESTAPERVIIETTGVADPGALSARLNELGHHLGAVITVVDALNARAVMDEPIGTAQVAAADFLVLSKVDLVGADGLAGVRTELAGLRPRAVVLEGQPGPDGLALLFGADLPRRPSGTGATPDLDFEAVSWTTDRPLDRPGLLGLLGALPGPVYRAKGVVRLAGASVPAVVDVVAGRVGFQWEPTLPLGEPSRLVFIGRNQKSWWGALSEALNHL
jgi:cobalamin biosynthesis protein CobW